MSLGFSPTEQYFRHLMSNEELEQDRRYRQHPPEDLREKETHGDDPRSPRALDDLIRPSKQGEWIGDEFYSFEDLEKMFGDKK